MAEKKIVRIPEEQLVKICENIVNEAVAAKKKEWIREYEEKQASVIEEQVDKVLKERLAHIITGKK